MDRALMIGPSLPQTRSLLFRIPTEIRLYIYELVFTETAKSATNVPRDRRPLTLALLETCRLVLHEAETIFFSINRLRLDLKPFPDFLSDRRREMINAVKIVSNNAVTVLSHIEALQPTCNVQSLHIVSPTNSVRFVNIQHWKIMAPQIETALKRLTQLREVKVLWGTSAPETAEPGEPERERQFAKVAERLEAAVAPL